MSEIGDSMRRLESAFASLEADDKILAVVHFASIGVMAGAVVWQFGLSGAAFLIGGLLWKTSGWALSERSPSPPSKEGE